MILKRIKQYIDFKGVTVAAFERSIGMSNASFGKSLKNGGTIGADKLEKLLNIYTDINPTWLLTGVGPMLLDVAPPAQVSSVNSAVAMHGTITNESAGGESSVSQELKMAQQKIEALEKLLDEKERLIKVLLDKNKKEHTALSVASK